MMDLMFSFFLSFFSARLLSSSAWADVSSLSLSLSDAVLITARKPKKLPKKSRSKNRLEMNRWTS